MKKLYILLLLALFSETGFAQGAFRGLDFTYVTDLTIYQDTIYASTYDGIYKQENISWNNPVIWTPCGMQGRHVVQTFVPDYQTFICLVEIDSSNRTQIYKSIDGGNSFNLMNTDTSDVNGYQWLDAMAHPPGNYDTLYFLNHHLKTYNGGLSWDTIHSQLLNDRFIAVNPYQTNQLIIGGETFILSAYIQVSNDYGNTWSIPAMNGFFAGDNSVHDISFDLNGNMYAAGEGVVCISSDGGNNWTQVYNSWSGPPNFSLYNWDIEVGNYGIYFTGSNSNASQVPLIWNYPLNSYWDTLSTTPVDSLNPEMKCLAITPAPFGEDVYVGGHGVYIYNIIMGGIEENEENEIVIYPNPFNNFLNINFKNTAVKKRYCLAVYNSIGKLMLKENYPAISRRVNLSSIPAGIYIIQVSDENGMLKRSKFIKQE